MGNNQSAPVREHEEQEPPLRRALQSVKGSIRTRRTSVALTPSPQHARTLPRSIDIADVASPATLALRPLPTGNTPPKPLSATLKNRKVGRSALTFFSCGRNMFIYFAGMALLERDLINAAPGSKSLEDAAEQVWMQIAMYSEHRPLWEDAASQAKIALVREEFTADALLEAHCVPQHKTQLQRLAMQAVNELFARHAAGTWPADYDDDDDETRLSPETTKAARRASYMTSMSETAERRARRSIEREIVSNINLTGMAVARAPVPANNLRNSAIERDPVSAINMRDMPEEEFVGFEPSIRRFSARSVTPKPAAEESCYPFPTSGPTEVVDAAATARLYLDLNMTPPTRSNRDSLVSITPSLSTDVDTEAEIITAERVTPSKAKIVNV